MKPILDEICFAARLKDFKLQSKSSFLGDMLELGENEVMLHEEIYWQELADVDIVYFGTFNVSFKKSCLLI